MRRFALLHRKRNDSRQWWDLERSYSNKLLL